MPLKNQTATANTPSPTITKKIGNTIYKIQINFSKVSKDTLQDKLLRIVKHELAKTRPPES